MQAKKTRAFIICDLGFGDSGKGTTVDYLARVLNAGWVVRYTGGPQAAHNVVTPENIWHCFAQFGSGTMVEGVRTYLSPKMLISPHAFMNEFRALEEKGFTDAALRTDVSSHCLVVTPWHAMVGQMLEIERGRGRYGSCGMGVGQAVYDSERGESLTVADIFDVGSLKDKLELHLDSRKKVALEIISHNNNSELRERFDYFMKERTVERVLSEYRSFAETISGSVVSHPVLAGDVVTIIFEGAQGALLDRTYGFYPYITKTSTTHHNASAMLSGILPSFRPHKLGVIRAYGHRHGAGPFPTEDVGLGEMVRDKYNATNPWQGRFRVGWLDLPLLRYGLAINDGIDSLCVTCIDQLAGLSEIKVCVGYKYRGATCGPNRYLLNKYFNVTNVSSGGTAELAGIKKMSEDRELVGRMLFNCKPIYTSFSDTDKLLDFIESREGLGVPVSIISRGPRRDQKKLDWKILC